MNLEFVFPPFFGVVQNSDKRRGVREREELSNMTEDRKAKTEQFNKQIEEFRNSMADKASKIMDTQLPSMIIHLNDFFKTPLFDLPQEKLEQSIHLRAGDKRKTDESAHEDGKPPAKKRRIDTQTSVSEVDGSDIFPVNQVVKEFLSVLKREFLECIDMFNTVKMWIQLNIPRIEDGNNFGVGIQEEAIAELTRAEDHCYACLENVAKYHVARAKLISKILKYPLIDDYPQSVYEIDMKQYADNRLSSIDLRNNLAIVYDLITKNLDKIVKPRTSHMLEMF